MLFGLKASIIDSNKYITEEDSLQYIIQQAMFTPINMDKESGIKEKENLL